MNINRSNYEYYFLLYADKELSASEMLDTENFVAENQDLADELNGILNSRLDADQPNAFPDKSILYRTASTEINSINLEAYLLLLLDGELDEVSARSTMDFMAAHPEHHSEWEMLQQTRLTPEELPFPDKKNYIGIPMSGLG